MCLYAPVHPQMDRVTFSKIRRRVENVSSPLFTGKTKRTLLQFIALLFSIVYTLNAVFRFQQLHLMPLIQGIWTN